MHNERNSKNTSLKTYLLNLLSILYKSISFINLKLKSINKKKYEGVYIISIDNLSFGGTGKTPLVIRIGKELKKNKINFCIITRGYRSLYEKTGKKVNSQHSINEIGDEAALFRHYFPETDIYIGKNRFLSIETAINNNNKVILLDDGFQTSGLYKDMKIMLFNPEHDYYYLRNFKFFIKEEDLVFYLNNKEMGNNYSFLIDGFFDLKGNKINISDLKHDVVGFSALGDNKRFKQTLTDMKLNLVDFIKYNDHFPYSKKTLNDLNIIRKKNNCTHIICSEKDYIKIKELNIIDIPLIYVKNSIKLDLNLVEKIIQDAKRKGIIKTQN